MRKFLPVIFLVVIIHACVTGHERGEATPDVTGGKTVETNSMAVVLDIKEIAIEQSNFRGSSLSENIVNIELWSEGENIPLYAKANDALIKAGQKYNIEGGSTYLISTQSLVDSKGDKQNVIFGLVLDASGQEITPTPDPKGNVLVPLTAIFFYTESDGLAFVPPGKGLDIAGGRMLPLGYWEDEDKAYLGFGVEGEGATIPVFEITQDGKVLYHDPYSKLTTEVQQDQFPTALGKALFSLKQLPTPAHTQTFTPTPEQISSFNEKLKSESYIETIETVYKEIPVKVNILSHNSIKGNIYSHTEYVYPDRSIPNYDQIVAKAFLQGLAQTINKNADSLAYALKQDPSLGIPVFATDLTKSGYNPQNIVFYPINQETGMSNEINIVFMNVSSKDFPGDQLKAITGAYLGRGIDNNGNLYIFQNYYPNRAIYTSLGLEGIDLVTTAMFASGLESLCWKGGQTDTSHIKEINQRTIKPLLINSNNPIFKTFGK